MFFCFYRHIKTRNQARLCLVMTSFEPHIMLSKVSVCL